jgi:hypothetical protein
MTERKITALEDGALEIPIGKALIAKEIKKASCRECAMRDGDGSCFITGFVNCCGFNRKDGKNVIYKLVNFI